MGPKSAPKPPVFRRLVNFLPKNRRLSAGFVMRKPAPAEPAKNEVKNRRFSAGKKPADAGSKPDFKSGLDFSRF